MTTAVAVVAASWAVVMGLAPLLQLRRMHQVRSSRDVSIGYLALMLPGFALWVVYGSLIHNAALIVPNAVALVVSSVTVAYAVRLRRPPGEPPLLPR